MERRKQAAELVYLKDEDERLSQSSGKDNMNGSVIESGKAKEEGSAGNSGRKITINLETGE